MSLCSQELNSSQTTVNFISNYRPFHVVSKIKQTNFRQNKITSRQQHCKEIIAAFTQGHSQFPFCIDEGSQSLKGIFNIRKYGKTKTN